MIIHDAHVFIKVSNGYTFYIHIHVTYTFHFQIIKHNVEQTYMLLGLISVTMDAS